MKRVSVLSALCLVLCGAFSGRALRRNSGSEWLAHTEYGDPIKCHRIGYAKSKCKMSWVVGDVGFTGKGSIWVHGAESGASRYYRFTIYRVNEYCASVEHGSYDECVERIHVS